MNKMTDYLYASVPSFCLAVPVAQIMPDLQFVQGIEKLGIVGVLTLGMMLFLWERRHFMAKTAQELRSMDKRLEILETTFASGNDKVIHLLGEQLDAMRELKDGQTENFSRMWTLTLRSLSGGTNEFRTRSEDSQKPVL
jgi:hypothetical protein